MIKNYLIDSEFANTRLDRWFKKKVCHVPQSLIEKNIRKGKIKVNKKKESSSYKLKLNDKVLVINFDPKPLKNNKIKDKYKATKKEVSSSKDIVIFNNEDFIVINKPSGIAVQSGTKSKRNIIDILKKTDYFINSTPYTVHRIDKDTTGVLIIAKNRKYAQLLTSLFRIRKIHKTYLAVVIGVIDNPNGIFKDQLLYYENNKKISFSAITHYKVLYNNYNYSLLKLNPITGRKHQIRKQLLLHEHPILGDTKYGFIKDYKYKNNNLMLHAHKIKFFINNKKYEFTAEPSLLFKKVLKEKNLKIF